ncbi:ribosomal protection-like ABC-F family protein [Pseudoramibacter sp.]|jgi:ATP-binding cassette subfamily F protein 3|uniref:ribosomal protection-like ABC-F family protein n=1 Tax=Pseudoramibacter sp. TaxID=2034862 RepID=UPI0025EA9433|nr:ABC-F family ATP-binding cassette domain-containing protein [Pseudoramibacter sp.]MCH4072880.1 ABC-F family ATP-binding cassette domain-containing protein [Pseudoramibacter sp.]MCH4106651.1 ABC-F family ATP-binding cassette domain-containing protein [Pseudoramibacter sp.]
MLLNVDHVSFSYGDQQIFQNLTFSIQEHQKLGLIGKNGAGKTTLFNLMTGELLPDNGAVHRNTSIQIGYLKQEQTFESDLSLHDVFLSFFLPLIEIENKMKKIQGKIDHAQGQTQEDAVIELADLQEKYKNMGGYSYPSRIRGVMAGLGLAEEDLNRKINTFSSGQKTKIALGSLLLQEPDLLLLDEPTNYLDIHSLNWLENMLRNYPKSFVVISHDRYLLDHVCTSISEIQNHNIVHYKGNYSSFRLKKKKADAAYQKKVASYQEEIKHQEAIISKLRGNFTTKNTKRAKSREKNLEKMKNEYSHFSKSDENNNLHLSLKPSVRSSNDVLKIKQLSKSFDNLSLYQNLNLEIFRGDRIGIIGANGAGKSTLLKIIKRELLPDSGRLIFGENVHIGYYSQESEETFSDPSGTLIDALRTVNIKLSDGEIRNILAQFMFRNDDVFKPVNELSGGEKSRLRLAMLMISQANLLLLDEPTNHIDMDTKEILEDALIHYSGTIITVSHDRYFLNKIATRIVSISSDQILDLPGNYDDYRLYCSTHTQNDETTTHTSIKSKDQKNKTQHEQQKKIRNQKKDLEKIEKHLDKLTLQLKEIEKNMGDTHFYEDPQKAEQGMQQYAQIKKDIAALTQQWEELAMKLENN